MSARLEWAQVRIRFEILLGKYLGFFVLIFDLLLTGALLITQEKLDSTIFPG